MPSIGIAKLDLEDAHPGLQTHRTPSRAGRIPVRVDDDGAGLVGLHAPPATRVEPDAGQGRHVVLLRFEQFPHWNAIPAVVRPGDAFARVQPHAGRRPEALGRRHRHHQIAPREADRVLHTALLPAAPGIAEPDLDAVALNKPLEHVDDGDSVPRDPVRGAGGVVEHHHPRGQPTWENTVSNPSHTHSAFSPGSATT